MNVTEPDMLLPAVEMNSSSYFDEEIILTLTSIFVPVAFCIILTVGLVGNLLVITVVSFD